MGRNVCELEDYQKCASTGRWMLEQGSAMISDLGEPKVENYFEDERKQDLAHAKEFVGEVIGSVGAMSMESGCVSSVAWNA